jgi:hypothetical protein
VRIKELDYFFQNNYELGQLVKQILQKNQNQNIARPIQQVAT